MLPWLSVHDVRCDCLATSNEVVEEEEEDGHGHALLAVGNCTHFRT